MGRFFDWALRDLGHEVFSVGPYSAGHIPWGDYYYPDHKFPPNFVLPPVDVPIDELLKKIPFKPDFILQAGDTIGLTGKSPVPNAILATDPHVVDYSGRIKDADLLFFMQKNYMPPNAMHIPYGYLPYLHFPLPKTQIKYDVVLCGLQYEHRLQAVEAMRAAGLQVFNALGLIYEDYNQAYARGKIAFVYPSKDDLPARFWEGLAMGKMVLVKRIRELEEFDFKEGIDYEGFSTIEEAVEKAVYYSKYDRKREWIAANGLKKVKPHTYLERSRRILSCLK